MIMKKIILIGSLFICQLLIAQEKASLQNVEIKNSSTIIKYVTVYDCETKVEAGKTLKTETKKEGKNKTFTISDEEKLTNDKTILTKRTIPIEMTGFGGRASLYTKDKQPGKTFVDYWLNPFHTVPKDTFIIEVTRKLSCKKYDAKNTNPYNETRTNKTKLKNDKTFVLYKVKKSTFDAWGTNIPDWFVHADRIIEVYLGNTNNINYYLVDKFDRDATYELKFKNREFIGFKTASFETGPLTIPFKYRFGYEEEGTQVNQEFTADLNIGLFAGWKVKQFGLRKEQGKSLEQPGVSLTVGGFLNLSAVTLSKGNTKISGLITDDNTQSIASLSPGIAVMLDFYNLNIGAFIGRDLAFGSKATKWDFHNRTWIGVGIGYNLNGFKKKE